MLRRTWQQLRVAGHGSRPLSVDEMRRMLELKQLKEGEQGVNEQEEEEYHELYARYEWFMQEAILPPTEEEEQEAKAEEERVRQQEQRWLSRIEYLASRAWLVALCTFLCGVTVQGASSFCFWTSMLALRVQVAHNLLCDRGFTRWHVMAILAIEAAYPLYRSLHPDLSLDAGWTLGTMGGALVVWVAITFAVIDRHHRVQRPPRRIHNPRTGETTTTEQLLRKGDDDANERKKRKSVSAPRTNKKKQR